MEISGVSSSAVYRPAVPLTDGALSDSASTPSAESAPGAGGFISPIIRYDQRARLAVLFFRDYDTGETRDQIPAKRVVEEYQRVAGSVGPAGDGPAAGTPASSAPSGRAVSSSPAESSSPPSAASPSASASGGSVSLTV